MTSQSINIHLEDLLRKLSKSEDIILGNLPYAVASTVLPLAADYMGLFGAMGKVDAPTLDAMATLGTMGGYFKGGRLVDSLKLAFPVYLTAKIGEAVYAASQTGKVPQTSWDLLQNAFAFAGALGAGALTRYAVDNWEAKTKPALYATGKGIGKATAATGKGIAYAAPIVWRYGIKKPVVATVKSPYTVPRWLWKHRPFQNEKAATPTQDPNVQDIDPTLN